MKGRRLILALSLAALCVAGVSPAPAQVDYKGKTVTISIGYGVGGSYHQYAQLFARHLGKFLPGNPAIVVQSAPGAGGVRMLNDAAVRMKADGTNIFMPPDTLVVTQLLEPGGLAYDARTFHYLGTADQQNTFWVVRRTSASSIADMKARDIFMGSSGKGSTGYMIPALGAPLLGLRVKHVGGYDSSREQILAMERGEIDGTLQAWQVWERARPTWFQADGYAVPLIQVGATPDPDAPPVPLLKDLAAPADRPVVALLDTIGVIGRGLATPPATPPEYVAALKTAFVQMLQDGDYRAEASKTQLRTLPTSSADVTRIIAETFATADAEVIKRAQALLK
jgi:tripartite-type tricarboxylate transporter receptor subunit TctC